MSLQNEILSVINLNEVPTNCTITSLVYISLVKAKAANSIATSYQTVCIYKDTIQQGLWLQVKRNDLTVIQGAEGFISSARTVTKSCEREQKDWRSDPTEIQRMKFLLHELKEGLSHRRDTYFAQIKELLNQVKLLRAEQVPNPAITDFDLNRKRAISAQRIQLDGQSSVQKIVLTNVDGAAGDPSSAEQLSVATAIAKLKQMKSNIEGERNGALRKRSADVDLNAETINVRDLIVEDPNVFKGWSENIILVKPRLIVDMLLLS